MAPQCIGTDQPYGFHLCPIGTRFPEIVHFLVWVKIEDMKIFNIPIHNISQQELLLQAERHVQQRKSFRIATVNPEFLLMARRDPEFSDSLCHADMCVRDGFGIILAYWIRGKHAPDRIAGADLVLDLLKMANKNHWTVCIINNMYGLSTFLEIKESIQERYTSIKIIGFDAAPPLRNPELIQNSFISIAERIPASQIVFSSLGAPHQEILLSQLQKERIPAIMMGVGGSFDFVTGKVLRAPIWMQRLGIEWFFRFTQQPNRIPRIFRAIIVFPVLLFFEYLLEEK